MEIVTETPVADAFDWLEATTACVRWSLKVAVGDRRTPKARPQAGWPRDLKGRIESDHDQLVQRVDQVL